VLNIYSLFKLLRFQVVSILEVVQGRLGGVSQ